VSTGKSSKRSDKVSERRGAGEGRSNPGGKKVLLIDGNSLMHRAFHALPPLVTREGLPTNAIYGFLTMLFRLIEEEKPDGLMVAFDKGVPVFRREQYSKYKANRDHPPEVLISQFPVLKEVLEALNIATCELEGYEADDILGTMSRKAEEEGYGVVVIVTGDRDALQLVSKQTQALITHRGIREVTRYDLPTFRKKYGIEPPQLVDVKGLMGDSSDNIPGVPGVGEKTALKLIQEYGSVEEVLENIARIQRRKLSQVLREYAQQALLSKRLATIERDAPINLEIKACTWARPDWDRVRKLFRKLEFKTLLDRIPGGEREEAVGTVAAGLVRVDEVSVVREETDLPSLVESLNRMKECAVLFEWEMRPERNGLKRVAPVAMALSPASGQVYYLDLSRLPPGIVINELAPFFEDPRVLKVGYEAKTMLAYLMREGIRVQGFRHDVAIAAYLLDPTRSGYPLDELAERYLHVTLPAREDVFGKGRAVRAWNQLAEDEAVSYLANRVDITRRLAPALETELEVRQLRELFETIEMPLVGVLAGMEVAGIRVDSQGLAAMSEEFRALIDAVTGEIYALAGTEFNLNSPKQMAGVLFERLGLPATKRTKTGYSTSAEVLEALAREHEIAAKILEYRQLTKLLGTYIDGLREVIDPCTGRVHTTFNQTITATGRISSTEPNLQNIPVRMETGRRIRKVFIPSSEGHVLLGADYSQIELRVLAHLSGDEGLQEAFRRGEDIHTRTASEVFGVHLEEVTETMRSRAKSVNFGIIYGISDFGLARDTGVSREEAREYIEQYFRRYPMVKKYLDETVQKARKDGYVTTIFSRRRYLPDINSRNRGVRSFAERTAMNTPIQGSAADIIKLAMVRVQKELCRRHLTTKILLQVHDELVFDVPVEELAEVKELVRRNMEGVVEISVPLVVEMRSGQSWYDLK